MLEYYPLIIGAILGAAGLSAALFCILHYRSQIRQLEQTLDEFESKMTDSGFLDLADEESPAPRKAAPAILSDMAEKRESKLVSRLSHILKRTSLNETHALKERDQVTSLLSDLSHQLKTPLSNIVMYTELLSEGGLSTEEQKSFLSETRRQSEKMQWLMKNMLKASQLEQGILSFSAGYTTIKPTIGKAVSSVYARAAKKDIHIEMEEFPDRRLYHNPKWTVEALGNILDNAIKYSPAGSVVTIRLLPLELYTRIEIEDQGMGISPAHYNDIFKRFYREEQASQTEGNGLGLYLSQLILNTEKGYITAAAGRDGGACFQIFLLNEVESSKGLHPSRLPF